ncbi:MAG: hypothetical protein WAQ98_11085 [Blastocatellia bacterium]
MANLFPDYTIPYNKKTHNAVTVADSVFPTTLQDPRLFKGSEYIGYGFADVELNGSAGDTVEVGIACYNEVLDTWFFTASQVVTIPSGASVERKALRGAVGAHTWCVYLKAKAGAGACNVAAFPATGSIGQL